MLDRRHLFHSTNYSLNLIGVQLVTMPHDLSRVKGKCKYLISICSLFNAKTANQNS
jgi:hypothetical protein